MIRTSITLVVEEAQCLGVEFSGGQPLQREAFVYTLPLYKTPPKAAMGPRVAAARLAGRELQALMCIASRGFSVRPICSAGTRTFGTDTRSARAWQLLKEGEKWLQGAAVRSSKRIFLYNLRGALLKTNEALGMEAMYVQRVDEAFGNLWRHESGSARGDERSQYHLQAGCLVLATYRVLSEQLRLEQEQCIKIIQQCMGDSDSFSERIVQGTIKAMSTLFLQVRICTSAHTWPQHHPHKIN